MATTIYFVRHGRTENEGQIIYGRMPGYPLSSEGREEVNRAGVFFQNKSISQIYTSPLQRTFETAEIISQHLPNTKLEHLFDLTETESTYWQGLTADRLFTNDAYEAFINDPEADIGTENLSQLASRMQGVVKRLLQKHRGQSVVCVSHEFPILALKFKYENKPLVGVKTIHLKTGGVMEFVFDDQENFVSAKEIIF
jgi:broad specificity phosphatase PhoE